jgi:phytoene synthase
VPDVIASAQDALTPAFAAAAAIVRRADRDAFLAGYFLPKHKRNAVFAVLAFCQMIREAIASPETTLENARGMREHPAVVSPQHVAAISGGAASACGCGTEVDERVAMFRDRLAEIYEGRVELPAIASRSEQQHAIEALGQVVHEYRVPRQLFLDLAEGLRADQCVRRYATWNSLQKHLYGTAGVVGVIVSGVLGVTHSDAAAPASALGNAIRLTRILHNLREDVSRGQIYLPLENMVRHRVTEQELIAHASRRATGSGCTATGVLDLVKHEVGRARELLRSSAERIPWLADDGSRLAASAIIIRAAGELDAIEAAGFDVFTVTPTLTRSQKLRRLPAVWRLARRREDEPLRLI